MHKVEAVHELLNVIYFSSLKLQKRLKTYACSRFPFSAAQVDGKRSGVYVTKWNVVYMLLLGEKRKGEELEEGVPRHQSLPDHGPVMAFIASLNNTCHLN